VSISAPEGEWSGLEATSIEFMMSRGVYDSLFSASLQSIVNLCTEYLQCRWRDCLPVAYSHIKVVCSNVHALKSSGVGKQLGGTMQKMQLTGT
jgi:hypothetical protein